MKLSIIIPIYRLEKNLKQYLDSIIKETIQDLEIICINTINQDIDLIDLKEYEKKYSNFKFINKSNISIGQAINIGARKAQGEYIIFLDNEEYTNYNILEKFYKESKKHDLDILLFKSNKIDYDLNSEIKKYEMSDNNILLGEDFFNFIIEKDLEGWENYFSYFFKKEFIDKINLEFDEINIYKTISIIKANRIKFIEIYSNSYEIIENNNILSNEYKYSKINYIQANKIEEVFIKYNFTKLKTKLNLQQYIEDKYKRALHGYDLNLELNNRIEMSNRIYKNNRSIELSMQIDTPKLYYSMNLNKKNLFIVHTPYHILLAVSIINMDQYRNFSNEIFINNYFNINDIEISKIKKIFSKVYILGREDSNNLLKINSLLDTNTYANIFVNNESEVHTQFILNTRLKANGKIIYVEDGSACYYEPDNNIKNGIGKEVAKNLSEHLKMNIEDIDHFGTYSNINERYFIYPQYVKAILNDNKKNKEIYSDLIKRSIDILWNDSSNIIDLNNNKKILILLEHIDHFICNTEYSKEQYINLIYSIIKKANKRQIEIYIKYHPRDDSFYLKDILKNYSNITYLEKSIPIEVFYKARNINIVALKTTAILTFSKILGSKNIICINNLLTYKKDEFIKLIENKIKVNCPSSIEELELILESK